MTAFAQPSAGATKAAGAAAAAAAASPVMVADAGRNFYYNAAFVVLVAACVLLSVRAASSPDASSGSGHSGKSKDRQDQHDDDDTVFDNNNFDKDAFQDENFENKNKNGAAAAPHQTLPLGPALVLRSLRAAAAAALGPHPPVRAFQLNYLAVYALVFISDWLQGPYIYALYKSYNYELDAIALLFVTGFLSSAVFGTFVGSIADRFGRRLGSLMFCVFYSLSCITKLSSEFNVLMLGRLLGGISTSLLFSVFESWMVSEHHSRLFDESLLSETFAWSTFVNGLVAIISGVLANIVVDVWGLVAPFMVAMVFLVFAFVLIQSSWTENYGNRLSVGQYAAVAGMTKVVSSTDGSDTPAAAGSGNTEAASDSAAMLDQAPSKSFMDVVRVIRNDPSILAVGTMQFCFESAMYTFVFLWSPVMEQVSNHKVALPFGIMFSSFMVCIMIGSTFFKMLVQRNMTHEWIAKVVFAVAAITFLVPAVTNNEVLTYIAFNIFEVCCGMYFPAIGSIRSKVVPEDTRSTVMNIFRIPLNMIVVVILLKVNSVPSSVFFVVCCVLNGVAFWVSQQLVDATMFLPMSSRTVYLAKSVGDDGDGGDVFKAASTGMPRHVDADLDADDASGQTSRQLANRVARKPDAPLEMHQI